jgi:hypothetical protein
MSRGARRHSESVGSVLEEAEQNLLAAFKKSSKTKHKGLKGDARASSIAAFLEKRLPAGYGVLCKAEVVDYSDQRFSELDIVIVDKIRNAVLSDDPLWVPAESLLAYIEVKSLLTSEELRKSYLAATKVSSLKPFKRKFTLATDRTDSAVTENESHSPLRCFRTVFAYQTDLSGKDWLDGEWQRIRRVTGQISCTPNEIDRILVLDTGLINPPAKTGTDQFSESSVFQQLFINLVNFLARENGRRPAFDFQSYTRTQSPGWKSLDSGPS